MVYCLDMIQVGDLIRFRNRAIRRSNWLNPISLVRRKHGKVFRGRQIISRVIRIVHEDYDHVNGKWKCLFEIDYAVDGHFLRLYASDVVLHRRDPKYLPEPQYNAVRRPAAIYWDTEASAGDVEGNPADSMMQRGVSGYDHFNPVTSYISNIER